ncbi:Clavaminate synthase-like protein [Aspergillus steynii IBT 23096]|uniref:Clavaminate synthase-like protein n=1 Tax=Aspergillus steynii IBT 23096 TaxID=1392250 RepID=A0A2I2FZZ1_9EURO|nr:Clavaminate synthase-like protein [Aspergillus steynii IBT 23096]PLB46184.1 Clavaminate synthase-like protein [Aspergillus steynii IBT 23096]
MPRAPPIIDFAGFHTPDPILKSTFLNQIRQACQDHGFFQITNHGIPDAIQASILSQAHDLFSLPLDVKEKYSMDRRTGPMITDAGPSNRGYERFRAQNFEKRGPGDLKEGFYLGKDLPATHPSVVAGKFSQGPNPYPGEIRAPGEFRRVVDEYHGLMCELAGRLMRAVAMTVGMEEDSVEAFCEEPVAILRLLRYPPQAREEAEGVQRGIGAHTDFGAITILLQDDKGGLQVWDGEASEWADVVPTPGALVVNLGNMMMRWTNDRYLSNLHRVINYSGEDRCSVPFFFSGNPDYVVDCLPSCRDDGQAKYPPITVAEWMGARYADTYGSSKKGMAELSREAAAAIGAS